MITKASFAKVNLFLNVIGYDNNSYHLLESLFVPLKGLRDQITFKKANEYSCNMNAVIPGENIITKAVLALEQYTGQSFLVQIKVEKNIPLAGGLGGGSSNAAHTLLALNELYELHLKAEELLNIGIELGADVPFFLQSEAALVKGIGEKVHPVKLGKTFYILLVNSGIQVSTHEVYKKSVSTFSSQLNNEGLEVQLLEQVFRGHNALEEPALYLYPQLQEVISLIGNQKGNMVARLSGSGGTCFGLFAEYEFMRQAYNKIKKVYPDFWVHCEDLIV